MNHKANPPLFSHFTIAFEKTYRLFIPIPRTKFFFLLIWMASFLSPQPGFNQRLNESDIYSATTTSATADFELPSTTLQDWETDIRDMMDISLDTDSLPNLFPSLPAISNATITQPTIMIDHIKLSLVVGSIAGIEFSEGNITFVREGEVLNDPQFGSLQISNVSPNHVGIRQLATNISVSIPHLRDNQGSLPSKPQDHRLSPDTDLINQQPDTIQFQLDSTIVPQSPILNYRFKDSLRLQNVEISHFLDLLHKITNLEFSLEAQNHHSLRPTFISVELEAPTLREVFMTALPPVGLWFEINHHKITLFSLNSRLK